MRHNYTFKGYEKDRMARVIGRSLEVSLKQASEIGNFINGKTTEDSKKYLENVISKKAAIPFKKFNKGVGHKKGMGPGRYPVKTSTAIKDLLESVEANAQFKGLNTSSLSIIHISANKAATQWHYGRQRRRQMKRTHVEIVVEETKKQKQETKETKKPIKEEKTKEIKESKSETPKIKEQKQVTKK